MPPEASSDLEALERFVAENDELQELEEKIGRFNVFDALRITRREINHSNFLAWLLDPAESHGQGDLFLKAVLMDMLRQARQQGKGVPVSPVELDGSDLQGVEIRREWKNIDLLISCQTPSFVVAIENKVDSGEHSGQLKRYRETVDKEFGEAARIFVFLTPDGESASEAGWVHYAYMDLLKVLARVRRMSSGSLGGDVSVFLDHYLNLIENQFMNNPEIERLCRRIYTNHQRAIDLIVEHAGSATRQVLEGAGVELSKAPLEWTITRTKKTFLNASPPSWSSLLPPIGTEKQNSKWEWVALAIMAEGTGLRFCLYIGPTTDEKIREKFAKEIAKAIGGEATEFSATKNKSWWRVWSFPVYQKPLDSEEPDVIVSHVVSKIVARHEVVERVTDAIRRVSRAD
jgi:hypothetical protein